MWFVTQSSCISHARRPDITNNNGRSRHWNCTFQKFLATTQSWHGNELHSCTWVHFSNSKELLILKVSHRIYNFSTYVLILRITIIIVWMVVGYLFICEIQNKKHSYFYSVWFWFSQTFILPERYKMKNICPAKLFLLLVLSSGCLPVHYIYTS